MLISVAKAKLLAEELRSYAGELQVVLGHLAEYGISLPRDSRLNARKDQLERLAHRLAKVVDRQEVPEPPQEELELLLLTVGRAIDRGRKEVGRLTGLSPNPEVGADIRARLATLVEIEKWGVFSGVRPAIHIGLADYLSESKIAELQAERGRLTAAFEEGTAPPLTEQNDVQDWRLQIAAKVDAFLGEHDTSAAKLTRKVGRIRSTKVRSILRRDAAEAVRLLCVESWKASFVLAGTVIEGILRERLDSSHSAATVAQAFGRAFPKAKSSPPLEDYKLHQLIDVSHDLKMIGTTSSRLLHGVRDLRNFVHVHAEARGTIKVGRRLAATAVSAMFDVIDLL